MKIPENFQMQAEPYTAKFAISESEKNEEESPEKEKVGRISKLRLQIFNWQEASVENRRGLPEARKSEK